VPCDKHNENDAPSLHDVTALVLAGGLGTRLRGVLGERQKVIASVGERPFLAYILDKLEAAGVKRVILCAGYQADALQEEFGLGYGGMNIVLSRESRPLGTGGALRLALPHIRSDHALILNGDSYPTHDLREFHEWHRARSSNASILLAHQEDVSTYGAVGVGESGRVQSFIEKGIHGPGWVNAGVYMLSTERIASIPQGKKISIETDMFSLWSRDGLHAFKGEGDFLDIGTPERYRVAEAYLETHQELVKESASHGH